MKTTIDLQQNTINALSRAGPTTGTGRPIDITDPPMYSGSRTDLPKFIDQLRLKIHGNATRFPSTQHQVPYAVSRLDEDAFTQIQPKIKGTTIDIDDVEALIVLLEEAFGDPDKIGTAQRELAARRQGRHDFARYLTDFLRISNKLEMTDLTKIFTLRAGLSSELKDELLHRDEPTDLTEFIKMLKKVDIKIRAHRAENQGQSGSRAPPVRPSPPGRPTRPASPNSRLPRPWRTRPDGSLLCSAGPPPNLSAGKRSTPKRRPLFLLRRSRAHVCFLPG